MKWRIGGTFSTESLRRIFRIPLRLKCSSWWGGSTAHIGGSRWPPVVVGGGGEVWECWGGFSGRKEEEMAVSRY
ncbi:hypothetical protein HKD37_11G032126 [Glycine soja]